MRKFIAVRAKPGSRKALKPPGVGGAGGRHPRGETANPPKTISRFGSSASRINDVFVATSSNGSCPGAFMMLLGRDWPKRRIQVRVRKKRISSAVTDLIA